jgi:hypothetical protein
MALRATLSILNRDETLHGISLGYMHFFFYFSPASCHHSKRVLLHGILKPNSSMEVHICSTAALFFRGLLHRGPNGRLARSRRFQRALLETLPRLASSA